MRAPAFTTAPSSMKQGPSMMAPSSTRAPGEIHAVPGAPANGAATQRPSMMSRCTCVYFSGVPMSIQ